MQNGIDYVLGLTAPALPVEDFGYLKVRGICPAELERKPCLGHFIAHSITIKKRNK
jgi:hypothetical protein